MSSTLNATVPVVEAPCWCSDTDWRRVHDQPTWSAMERLSSWARSMDGGLKAAWNAMAPLRALKGEVAPGTSIGRRVDGKATLDATALDAALNEAGPRVMNTAARLGKVRATMLLVDAVVATARSRAMTEDDLGPVASQILGRGRGIAAGFAAQVQQQEEISKRQEAERSMRVDAIVATMPVLKGSERQVAWATQIRRDLIDAIAGSGFSLSHEDRLVLAVMRDKASTDVRLYIDTLRWLIGGSEPTSGSVADLALKSLAEIKGFERILARAEAEVAAQQTAGTS